jgi:anaerobic dimethyl sulfoxide reductase subunit C (anchor subunit)
MNFRESALVAFTLLMQTSVGIVLVLGVLPLVQAPHLKGGGSTWALNGRLDTPMGVAAAAAALGLLASLLHLGQPILAWLALANVRGSWLSREIALAILFAAALTAAAFAHAGDRCAPLLRSASTALAIVAGLALVFAMARVYMIAGQPAWDRLATPISFLASTILLGLVVIVVFAAPRLEPHAARLLGVAAIALLAFQVLLVPALLAGVAAEPAAAISPASVGHAAMWLATARVVAAIAAAVLLVILLRAGHGGHLAMGTRYALITLVFVSEILGRMLFYAASVRLGPV